MIKFSSTGFVIFLVLMLVLGIFATFLPGFQIFSSLINITAILLLIMGVLLIISLIKDRFEESKRENDDHKKY